MNPSLKFLFALVINLFFMNSGNSQSYIYMLTQQERISFNSWSCFCLAACAASCRRLSSSAAVVDVVVPPPPVPPDAANVVIEFEAAEALEVPSELVAVTVNV